MSILSEFKEFAVKGNVVDMAVGIIIGGAFGKIVNSLVSDIVMPPLGYILGKVNFADLQVVLKPAVAAGIEADPANGVEAVAASEAVAIKYGAFIQNTVDFLVIAFCIFLVVKGINALRRATEKKAAEEAK